VVELADRTWCRLPNGTGVWALPATPTRAGLILPSISAARRLSCRATLPSACWTTMFPNRWFRLNVATLVQGMPTIRENTYSGCKNAGMGYICGIKKSPLGGDFLKISQRLRAPLLPVKDDLLLASQLFLNFTDDHSRWPG